MSHLLTQHRVSSPGDLLDRVRLGGRTILDSVEFDVSADPTGQLQVGHPLDLMKYKKAHLPPASLNDMLRMLGRVWVRQIVIDVKALQWNSQAGRAEFSDHELTTLLRELPGALQHYREQVGDLLTNGRVSAPEIVIASVNGEFFKATTDQDVQFGAGVKTRWFARDTDENPFAEARRLGVEQVGLQFPGSDPSQKTMMQSLDDAGRATYVLSRLSSLRDMQQAGHQDLGVSFYIINEPHAEQQIRQFFPEAEIISDKAAELEPAKETRSVERGL